MQRNDLKSMIDKLNEENYDTDAIQHDCNGDHKDSNIFHFVGEYRRFWIIKDYCLTINLHQYTFWPGDGIKATTSKYTTLKEEILNNKIYALTEFEFRLLLQKPTKYIQ